MTFGEELPGGLKWAYPTSRLINCTFGKSFNPDMPSSRRFMPAMGMQVAELVVYVCTTGR
tara:strand:+ start:276 stop:455 length:180 start_codon:yes stop_codon:yes gene_type:complete